MTQTQPLLTAALIALAQDSARIVLGDDATAAQIAELTDTMRPWDWQDLADTAGLPHPTAAARTAAMAHLRMAALADEARAAHS